MVLLSTATQLYAGNSSALKAYLGETLVWQKAVAPTGPTVLFSGSGSEPSGTVTPITIPAGVATSTTLFLYRGAIGTLTSSDPNVLLLANASLPNIGRMTVWNCDNAGKSFTITSSTATTQSWFVVGMDAPRLGAAALGQAANTNSVVPGLTLNVAVLNNDRAIGAYAANNAVPVWTTPALETILFSQTALGSRVHLIGGTTPLQGAAAQMVLGDADRGAVTNLIEHSAVALFRKA